MKICRSTEISDFPKTFPFGNKTTGIELRSSSTGEIQNSSELINTPIDITSSLCACHGMNSHDQYGSAWSDFRTARSISEGVARILDASYGKYITDDDGVVNGLVLACSDGHDHPRDELEQKEVAWTAFQTSSSIAELLSESYINGIETIKNIAMSAGTNSALYGQGATTIAIHATLSEDKAIYRVTSINIGDSLAIAYTPQQKRVTLLSRPLEFEQMVIGGLSLQPASITRFKEYQMEVAYFDLPHDSIVFTMSDGVWSKFSDGYEYKTMSYQGETHRYIEHIINIDLLRDILSNVEHRNVSNYVNSIRNAAFAISEKERAKLQASLDILSSLLSDENMHLYFNCSDEINEPKSISECMKEQSYPPEIVDAIEYIKNKENLTDSAPFLAVLKPRSTLGDDCMIYGMQLPQYTLSLLRSFVEDQRNNSLRSRVLTEIPNHEERSGILAFLRSEVLEVTPEFHNIASTNNYQTSANLIIAKGDTAPILLPRYKEESISEAEILINNETVGYWQMKVLRTINNDYFKNKGGI